MCPEPPKLLESPLSWAPRPSSAWGQRSPGVPEPKGEMSGEPGAEAGGFGCLAFGSLPLARAFARISGGSKIPCFGFGHRAVASTHGTNPTGQSLPPCPQKLNTLVSLPDESDMKALSSVARRRLVLTLPLHFDEDLLGRLEKKQVSHTAMVHCARSWSSLDSSCCPSRVKSDDSMEWSQRFKHRDLSCRCRQRSCRWGGLRGLQRRVHGASQHSLALHIADVRHRACKR